MQQMYKENAIYIFTAGKKTYVLVKSAKRRFLKNTL